MDNQHARISPRTKAALLAFALTAQAGSAQAGIWAESGNAGVTLAASQQTSGLGTLDTISGLLASADRVDIFAIRITNPAAFSASTVGGASFNTQLYLFNAAGLGITHRDDMSATVRTSAITGTLIPAPGLYYLAVSAHNADPLSSRGRRIWTDTPRTTERAPNGPDRTYALNRWSAGSGTAASLSGAYSIALTGSTYAIPTPGTMVLAGVGGLAVVRRKR